MKELQTLLNNNPSFLTDNISRKRNRKTRHLMFSTRDPDDFITIPLCANISRQLVIKRKLHGVDCVKCLEHIINLAALDSHSAALEYVGGYTPKIIRPDKDVMNERHAGRPTIKANKHLDASEFLNLHNLKNSDDLPGNIIGQKPETYYYNMVELQLIDDQTGELVSETIQSLQNALA